MLGQSTCTRQTEWKCVKPWQGIPGIPCYNFSLFLAAAAVAPMAGSAGPCVCDPVALAPPPDPVINTSNPGRGIYDRIGPLEPPAPSARPSLSPGRPAGPINKKEEEEDLPSSTQHSNFGPNFPPEYSCCTDRNMYSSSLVGCHFVVVRSLRSVAPP